MKKNFLRILHRLFISHINNDIHLKESKLNKNTEECLEKADQDSKSLEVMQ